MSIERFRDEVIRYLEETVLDEVSDSSRLYNYCKVRPLGEECIQVKNLSFLRKNEEEHLELANSELSSGNVQFSFHFEGEPSTWSTWDDILTEFSLKTDINNINPPYVVKWERTGDSGKLKSDERFDQESEYIAEDIRARPAIKESVREQLHGYIPRDSHRIEAHEVIPEKVRALYNLTPEQISALQ